jgi:hypothetical protein
VKVKALFRGVLLVALLGLSSPAFTNSLPCAPCAGLRVENPFHWLDDLGRPPAIHEDSHLWMAWTLPLDGSADLTSLESVRSTGARPWITVIFRTPQPVTAHLDRLESELRALADIARGAGDDVFIQASWRPEAGQINTAEHGLLLKRAAVTVTGASPDARFWAGPLAPSARDLRALYGEDVAAYIDGIALSPGRGLDNAVAVIAEIDPGTPVALDAVPWPTEANATLATAAEMAAAGISVTLFDPSAVDSADLAPLKVLAREFAGELSYAPDSSPTGAETAWAFIRAEDLGLRVIATRDPSPLPVKLVFGGVRLRAPRRIDIGTGLSEPLPAPRLSSDGLELTIETADSVVLLSFDRPTAEELDGFEDRIQVAGERRMPVEEILRRLQAFEDDQQRRIDHYQAINTLYLRLQAEQGSIDVSYTGDFFFRRDQGFDWVWEEFFLTGLKWRSKRMPEVPLVQPEKAVSMPVEIRLTADYTYRLRGTTTVRGRGCWVVDFKPIDPGPGRSLYQGTVWVDREIYARVRTRAIQLGLEGEVISNEEVRSYSPVDADGQPAPWVRESYFLPLRVVGQQTLSILSLTLPVERETVLTDVRINRPEFDRNRETALASDQTMVRDTDEGLRYLRKDEYGSRIVDERPRTSRLFLLGGVFWDESVNFPIPLAGVNYLDFDFKDSGNQLNVFFAGALLTASVSDPRLFDSRWNAGASLNGVFFKRTDELYREGSIVPEESVQGRTASASVYAGRPLTNFIKLDLRYRIATETFERADDTSDDFVIPQDTLTHRFQTGLIYARSGYRFGLSGSYNSRSDWQFWGLPGNTEYDPDQKDYVRWQATLSKTWWMKKYRSFEVSLEHLDGSKLDRFSGYDFGIFGDASVAGYQSGLVRAHQADGVHVEYGINYFDKIRFEVEGDAVWASNPTTGLSDELLAGIGIGGSLNLPWQLASDFEIGYALTGPGKGNFAARIFFLRLFPRK